MTAQDNVDDRTVEHFGQEWSRFRQQDADSLRSVFETYFRHFPWERLPPGATGFDAGCGSGRWARLVAPRVGHLHLVDASGDALQVARENCAGLPNCSFHQATVEKMPIEDGSMDFGYSLGVLHHVPDTQAALAACVRKLKPGAPFLVYLYYALDNRPAWYRALWKASDGIRRGVSDLPPWAKHRVADAFAFGVYWPLSRAARAMEALGRDPSSVPLAAYRHLPVEALRTDALDRFGTRLEQRFTRAQVDQMCRESGLEGIRFVEDGAFWTAVGTKAR